MTLLLHMYPKNTYGNEDYNDKIIDKSTYSESELEKLKYPLNISILMIKIIMMMVFV